jgi:DNA topoisomerase-2
MAKEQVQKVSHVQHILLRPDSYVGTTDKSIGPYWVREDSKFSWKVLSYSPALLKIFDEILVNAIDRNSMFPDQAKSISVMIDQESGTISVENSGPLGGVSVEKHPTEGIWNPELTFGHLLTSTNYDDNDQRVTGGRNGYGAKLANVYSKLFVVVIKDAVNGFKYQQKWENNMGTCHPPKITKYTGKESFVNICFQPDWARFGMTGMDSAMVQIIEKRVWDAMMCTSPKCSVTFQGSKIKKISFEAYCKMYLDEEDTRVAVYSIDRWLVAVAPSDGGFQQVSFVNGICTTKGGTHVDHVANAVSAGIIEELGKKIQLRPAHVKSTLFVFVISTLVNPTFSSQVKSECTLKASSFGSTFTAPQAFIKAVLRTGVQDEVLAVSKFREQKELKKTDGSRKSKILGIPKLDDANLAGTAKSDQCTLILTEGDSAKTLAVAGLSVVGRDTYGVFPLRGKCKNVRDASVKQLMTNQEFNDLKKIIGLQQEKEYKSVGELRYGRLMIMTDADNDGSHIKGLILNMIHYFWPSLLELGFVVSMVTPIIKATKGSQTTSYYTESAFSDWWEDSSTTQRGWKVKYYKGLGTSTSKEAQEYFKNIKNLTVGFVSDELTQKAIILAFDKKRADQRKQWLLESTAKPKSELEVKYGHIQKLTINDFVHKDLVNFSLADLHRSIADIRDGQKPSTRKVLYTCFKKNIKSEMKVAQLAAMVAEFTSYHHGEVSLADTIVKLAHDYVGSNNMNWLFPAGQFGTRLMGGKDSSQTRYIFTRLTKEAREMFDPLDDPVLKYLEDDGKSIEPEAYVPRLPVVLINGTEGIGTGFSTTIPSYNPDDIKANIRNILDGKAVQKMTPWFKGFKGKVHQSDTEGSWIAEGVYQRLGGDKYRVTELPPGRWTQDYKEHLESLEEKKIISGFTNNSTTETVNFEITGYEGKNLEKDLKMTKAIHTSNMHLFHPTKGIKKYESAEEILQDFVDIRLQFYVKRKSHMIKSMTAEMELLSNKARFIQMVVDDKIVIFRRKKAELELELEHKKFVKIDNSCGYLLDIKTYQYTEEAIAKMNAEVDTIKNTMSIISGTSIVDMWKNDILKC